MAPGVQRKQKGSPPERRHRLRIRPAYLFLVLLMGVFAFKFVQKTQEIKSLTAQEITLRNQNAALETSRANVKKAISYYRSPQYVESSARSVLGYTKPGETRVQVQIRPPVVERVRAAPVIAPPPAQPAWKQWWSTFFG